MKFIKLLFASVFFLAPSGLTDIFEDGLEAFEKESFAEAYPLLLEASQKNIFRANNYLIYLYENKIRLGLRQLSPLSPTDLERLELARLPFSQDNLRASVLMATINNIRRTPTAKRLKEIRVIINELIELSDKNILRAIIVLGKLALDKNALLRDLTSGLNDLAKNKKNSEIKKQILESLRKINTPEKYFLKAAFLRNKTAYKTICQLHEKKKIKLPPNILGRCILLNQEQESGQWEELVINAPEFEDAEKEIFHINSIPIQPNRAGTFLDIQKAKWRIGQAFNGNAAAFRKVAIAFIFEENTAVEEQTIRKVIADGGGLQQVSLRNILATRDNPLNDLEFCEAIGVARSDLGGDYERAVNYKVWPVTKNPDKALYWYKKSSEIGCKKGVFNEAAFWVFRSKEMLKNLSEDEAYELSLKYFNILLDEVNATNDYKLLSSLWGSWLVNVVNFASENNFYKLWSLICEKMFCIVETNPELFLNKDSLTAFLRKTLGIFTLSFKAKSDSSCADCSPQLEIAKIFLANASKAGLVEFLNVLAVNFIRKTDKNLVNNFTNIDLINYLNSAIKNYDRDPNSEHLSNAYYNIGSLYYQLSLEPLQSPNFDHEQMVLAYSAAIEKGDSDAAYDLGVHFYNCKEYDLAMSYFERARQMGNTLALGSIAVLELITDKVNDQTLEKLIAATSEKGLHLKDINLIYVNLASYHAKYSQDFEEVLRYFQKIDLSLINDWQKIKLLAIKGISEIKLNRLDEARTTLEHLAQPEYNYPKAHLFLALVALKEGNTSQLWAQLNQAEAAGLDNPFYRFKKLSFEKRPESFKSKPLEREPKIINMVVKKRSKYPKNDGVRNKDVEKLQLLLDPSQSSKLSPHKFDKFLNRVVVKVLGGSIKSSGVRTLIAMPGSDNKSAEKTGLHLPHAGQNQVGAGRASDISNFLGNRPEVKKILRR